jgi:hypothetical protein
LCSTVLNSALALSRLSQLFRCQLQQWHGRQTLQMTLGDMLYAMDVLEMLLGLVLASLTVAGFGGMLRGATKRGRSIACRKAVQGKGECRVNR